ncbi:hypothetical protein OOK60_17805 [Trichothermofontia sichuanensis B231]|uniref:hypothetical protein n=1 Tax=Trichothermofontia sichuanensis TaxID=3045816 RepID=UPI0022469C3F|nr:hypothetical protein [Trichothermofontia sichuanensis]UZQ54308.1 hypothetical protein OOK60_17805 [Trichothermofontia sichuanensis B231]
MNAGQPPTPAEMWKASVAMRRAHPCADLQAVFDRLESCGNGAIDVTHLHLDYLPNRQPQSGSAE